MVNIGVCDQPLVCLWCVIRGRIKKSSQKQVLKILLEQQHDEEQINELLTIKLGYWKLAFKRCRVCTLFVRTVFKIVPYMTDIQGV